MCVIRGGVTYSKDDDTMSIEFALITKMLENIKESLAKESPEKLEEFMKEIDFKDADGLYFYQISAIIACAIAETVSANVIGATAITSVGMTFGIGRAIGLINPILMGATTLWLVSDMMGTAYRVTVPAVVQIIFLRQRHIHRQEVKAMEENHKQVIDELENISDNLDEGQKIKVARKILKYFEVKLNILIIGATGVGKSSTIAALFTGGKNLKIGTGSNPQTQDISKFEISDNIIFWDSPGLGEGQEKDRKHTEKIIKMLQEKDDNGCALIDLVLVIVDATNKDLNTTYKLVNEVVIPNMPDKDRILIALNKCDCVIDRVDFVENGRNLTDEQIKFLESKVQDIKNRVKMDTGVDVGHIYYSAGLKKGDKPQETPYNITKLLYFITKKTPPRKRLVYMGQDNKEKGTDDGKMNYGVETNKSWWQSAWDFVKELVQNNKEIIREVVDFVKPLVKKIPYIIKIFKFMK